MLVEVSLAEMLINAIAQGRVPGVQFKRGWHDHKATFDGLQTVISDRLDGARRVAAEAALRDLYESNRPMQLKAENDKLRAVLQSLISSGSVTPIIKAMAMNALDAGSGDAWLASRA